MSLPSMILWAFRGAPVILFVCFPGFGLARDATSPLEIKQATAELKKFGLVVQGGTLMTDSDAELRRRLSDEKKLKKEVAQKRRSLDAMMDSQKEWDVTYRERVQQHRDVNARIPQASSGRDHNQLVVMLNELQHQLRQLGDARVKLDQQMELGRAAFSQSRDKYIGNVLAARKAVEAAEQKWRELPQRDDVRRALDRYNGLTGKRMELVAPKSLAMQIRALEKLEKLVLTDSIELRRDGGTFSVDVVVNGDKSMPMVVDSGASLVCLTYRDALAAKLDLQSATEVTLSIADGSRVKAQRIVIPTLRVGKFEAKDVEAAVLPAELPNAPALLGMSYLRNFQVSLDSDAARLQMTHLETAAATSPMGSRTRGGK